MLGGQDVAFRMRHQAQHVARNVAQPGQVLLRAVRIDRKRPGLPVVVHVAQHDLPGLVEPIKDPFLPAHEVAFAVSHGQLQQIVPLEKRAFAGPGLEGDPAILELAVLVGGQRCQRALFVRQQNQPGLEQHLKAVAHAEDQLFLIAEGPQHVPQEMRQLAGEDLARGHVVAIGEAARDDEDLKIMQEPGIFPQTIDVDALRQPARQFEGELRFDVAIGTGGTQDQYIRLGHVGTLENRPACVHGLDAVRRIAEHAAQASDVICLHCVLEYMQTFTDLVRRQT